MKIRRLIRTFVIDTMEFFLTNTGRTNFTQIARCGRSCESRFRQNSKEPFNWLGFNKYFLDTTTGHRIAIAIEPCYLSKSGKKTPEVNWVWSGGASSIKWDLEILGIPIIDADLKEATFLKTEQTFKDKLRGHKPKYTAGMKDHDSLTGWYLISVKN